MQLDFDANEATVGKLLLHREAYKVSEATPISQVDDLNEPRMAPRRAKTSVVPRDVGASRCAPLTIYMFSVIVVVRAYYFYCLFISLLTKPRPNPINTVPARS